jgi:hypothetical protein
MKNAEKYEPPVWNDECRMSNDELRILAYSKGTQTKTNYTDILIPEFGTQTQSHL